jgi:hypothetical protein
VAGPPVPRTQLWELGHGGDQPADTTHRFAGASGRVIVLRHPAPDNSVFALVTIPAVDRADSLTVRLTPVPDQYAITITGDALPPGTTLTFSYGIHFAPPDSAATRYPTALRFERALAIGRLEDDGRVQFLASERPASDVLRASLVGPGTYLVAAPR